MLNESDILTAIKNGQISIPPLEFALLGTPSEPSRGKYRGMLPDALVDVAWNGKRFSYAAEIKAECTPKQIKQAVEQVKANAADAGLLPMLIADYLSESRLLILENEGVSGIDLCGNGVVVVPEQLLVFRTGQPNRFPSRQIRNVYRGTSSLVPRCFLARPSYASVQGVLEEISARGGRLALSTVSKALKVLGEDLLIRRDGRTSVLIQPEEMMDRLAQSFEPPSVSARKKYTWKREPSELLYDTNEWGRGMVLTGESSAELYTVMGRERVQRYYCKAIEPIEKRLWEYLEESPRFADVELIETRDPTVYFDSRSENGLSASSPLQTWLELQAGDKRQVQSAEYARKRVLDELSQYGSGAGW